MTKAFIIVGLQFGDETKGATTDYLCSLFPNQRKLVVRYSGGSQAGHSCEHEGTRHVFNNFGSGSLQGVPTYWDRHCVLNPYSLFYETERLVQLGLKPKINIHQQCLVSTIYHQIFNQYRERKRGGLKHGTCGHGIGETRSYYLKYGQDAIFYQDCFLSTQILENKLYLLRERLLEESNNEKELCEELYSVDFFQAKYVIEQIVFQHRTENNYITPIKEHDLFIFEGAQGILLDQNYGFHPHTTWTDTTPRRALELCKEWGIEDIKILGLTRTNTTRHGNGPLPTYNPELTDKYPDQTNTHNEFQGNFRIGDLDLSMLEYSNEIIRRSCGRGLDGLVVSHLDQSEDGLYRTKTLDKQKFKHISGMELKYQGSLLKQESLTYGLSLLHDNTRYNYHDSLKCDKISLYDKLQSIFQCPVVIESDGATRNHKQTTKEGQEILCI